MDKMLTDLIKNGKNHFWSVLEECYASDEFVPALKVLIADGLMTAKDVICHYAYMANDVQAIADFVIENETVALEAADEERYFTIMSIFWKCGKHFDQLRETENEFIAQSLREEKVKGFEDYITGKTDVVPKSKKSPYSSYSRDKTFCRIYRLSPIMFRLCNFLFVNGFYEEIHHLQQQFYYEKEKEEFWEYLEPIALEHKLNYNLYWLNSTYVKSREEEIQRHTNWLNDTERQINGDLSIYERAFANACNPAKIYCLDKIYTTDPKYNPQILLDSLSAGKNIAKTAIKHLGNNSEWRDLVQPLLQSPKAVIADNAAQVLARYE
jgi:Fe-S-cluster containining protein